MHRAPITERRELEAAPQLGERYEILRLLGAGGMGKVYLARDRELSRQVAVKTLAEGLRLRPEVLARFEREAVTMARVRHPNLIRLFEAQLEGEVPFLAMEYVEGSSVDRLIERRPLTLEAGLRLAREVGGALGALHAAGVLHRDLKPANVMVRSPRGEAVLMDLGLARVEHQTLLTRTGVIVGTPFYFPAEVFRGEEWTQRSDVFQLGALLFECLSGRRLVPGTTLEQVATAMERGQYRSFEDAGVEVPAHVEATIARATDPDPGERFRSTGDLVAALEEKRPVITAVPEEPAPGRARPLAISAGLLVASVFLGALLPGGAPDPAPVTTSAPDAVREADRRMVERLHHYLGDVDVRERLLGFDASREDRDRGLGELRARWKPVLPRLPELLAGGLSAGERLRLWSLHEDWSRSTAMERMLGLEPEDLTVPDGAVGSRFQGRPSFGRTRRTPALRPVGGEGTERGFEIATPGFTPALESYGERPIEGVDFTWPEDAPSDSRPVGVTLLLSKMSSRIELVLSAPGQSGEAFRGRLWHPRPATLVSRELRGNWTMCFPADIGPRPGARVRVRAARLDRERTGLARLKQVYVSW